MLDILLIMAVQIIIESFPISSTGHMILAQQLWLRITGLPLTELSEDFDHFLHGPTVIILMAVFYPAWSRPLFGFMRGWWARVVCGRPLSWVTRQLTVLLVKISLLVIAADSMTACCYFVQKLFLKNLSLQANPLVVVGGFCVGMLLLFSLYFKEKGKNKNEITLPRALLLGLVQGLALLIPGCSRFASTYVAGRWLNLSRRRSFEFSFLMQFPLICAAFIFNGIPALACVPMNGGWDGFLFVTILLCATVIAGIGFRWVYGLALRGHLWRFGWYMVIPLAIMMLFIAR